MGCMSISDRVISATMISAVSRIMSIRLQVMFTM